MSSWPVLVFDIETIPDVVGLRALRQMDASVDDAGVYAAEIAERESLKRQVSEAKMKLMQAQVEPHFLFNTLGTLEHLIETDPAHAPTTEGTLLHSLPPACPERPQPHPRPRPAGRRVRVRCQRRGRQVAVQPCRLPCLMPDRVAVEPGG